MKQHYTQSKASINLDIWKIAEMSEVEARQTLQQVRWAENAGRPICPRCGCVECYNVTTRNRFKCAGCSHPFSVTSGSILAGRKIAHRRLLGLVAHFATASTARTSIEMARLIGCHPETARILCHKIREAMASETANVFLTGEVEIDGCYTGKYIRPANYLEDRIDRRRYSSPNKKVLVVARERGGLAVTTIVKRETLSIPWVIDRVDHEAIVHADEAAGWDVLSETFWMERVNHKQHYSNDRSNTNQAESFHSRFRVQERVHRHVSGNNLDLYAAETAWRENNRRVSDAERYLRLLTLALRHPISRRFSGYFQLQPTRGRRRPGRPRR